SDGWRFSFRKSSMSRAEPALDQGVDRIDAVDPADLLPLVFASWLVANRHLENPPSGAQQLRGNLGFEVETDAAQPNAVERRAPEHLVGGLHVGEPGAEEDIGQDGEELVGNTTPEGDTGGRLQETRAVDDVGAPVENRCEQPPVLVRIELEI